MSDTTETFIKMCDCPEIQGEWEKTDGDAFLYKRGAPEVCLVCSACSAEWGEPDYSQSIWLPLLHQSLEMVPLSPFHRVCDRLYAFTDWVKHHAMYQTSECSLEQLAIAFVMHELHSKTWTEEGWKLQGEDNDRSAKAEDNRQGCAEDEKGAEAEGGTETGLGYVYGILTRERV